MKQRIKKVQKQINNLNLSAILLFYSRDIFYYTGTAQPAYLIITPDDYFLYVKSGEFFVQKETSIEKDHIFSERDLNVIYNKHFSDMETHRIGTELDILTANEFLKWQHLFNNTEWVDISPYILDQRSIKDEYEISQIKKSAQAVNTGHEALLTALKKGVTELELCAAVENAHRLSGHEGAIFIRKPDFFMSRGPFGAGGNLLHQSGVIYSITGVGLSPAMPVGPSQRKIKKGDLIVVDIPTLINGYHIDQTRTYTAGTARSYEKDLFTTLKSISDEVISSIRPGKTCHEIYQIALDSAASYSAGQYFLDFGNGHKSLLIGHGLGLEANEPPIIMKNNNAIIKENQVLAVEMHFIVKDKGAIKLEDTIHVGHRKNKILTCTPRELFEVEW